MTNQQILEKAIQKAINGGWEYRGHDYQIKLDFRNQPFMQTYTSDSSEVYDLEQLSVSDVIFNHDFAKALWDSYYQHTCGRHYHLKDCQDHLLPLWQYRLQQMVIADDPIKYLGENL